MDYDELKTRHAADQALAESIELGNMRITGKNEQGQDLLELTAKRVTPTVGMLIESCVQTADTQKRDFTCERS